MKKTICYLSQIVGSLSLIAYLTAYVVLRLTNADMTSARFLLEYWHINLFLIGGSILVVVGKSL